MGAVGLPLVQGIQQRLDEVLDVAAQLRSSTGINQPVPEAQILPHLEHIAQPEASHDTPPNYQYVEVAARNVLYSLIAKAKIDSPEFVRVWNLLDVLMYCQDVKPPQCDSSLPLWLIEELLDTQTIHGCALVFDYMESRMRRLIPFGSRAQDSKTLVLMRSCNALLKRLSTAEDAVFCGRVLLFLFQAFPLGSKGLVNLRGEFNTDNITTWDETVAQEVESEANGHKEESEQMDVDSLTQTGDQQATQSQSKDTSRNPPKITTTNPSESAGKKDRDPVDPSDPDLEIHRFYPIFWSLQRFFSNPPSTFDPAAFKSLRRGLELTLAKFKTVQTTASTMSAPDEDDSDAGGTKRKRSEESEGLIPMAFASAFNPKYLTSFDLFALELSDRTFQRHILAQSLILLAFLLGLVPAAKMKLLAEVPKAQKSVLYSRDLSEEEEQWCRNTVKRISSSEFLCSDREGQYFNRAISAVLSRDAHWARWKAESCFQFELPPISIDTLVEAQKGAREAVRFRKPREVPMGALDLSFLREPGEHPEDMNGDAPGNMPGRPQEPDIRDLLGKIADEDFELSLLEPKTKANEEELSKLELEGGRALPSERERADQTRHQLKMERREIVERRAVSAWRALRSTTRTRFNVLSKIADDSDLAVLGKTDEEIHAEEEAARAEKAAAAAAAAAEKEKEKTQPDDTADDTAKANGDAPPDEEHGVEDVTVDVKLNAAEDSNADTAIADAQDVEEGHESAGGDDVKKGAAVNVSVVEAEDAMETGEA